MILYNHQWASKWKTDLKIVIYILLGYSPSTFWYFLKPWQLKLQPI